MQYSIVQIINISPKRLFKTLLAVDVGLLLANLAGYAGVYLSGGNASPLARRFILRLESSLPTWYSSIQLLACAVMLLLIGLGARRLKQDDFRHWWGLSALFLYISMDEVATFRESIADLLKSYINGSGIFYYSWVVIAIPIIILLMFLYARFIVQLPKDVRTLVLLAVTLFLVGGLGFEMVGALIHSASGVASLAEASTKTKVLYAIASTVEESLEIVGVTIFLYALLVYIRWQNVSTYKTNLLW